MSTGTTRAILGLLTWHPMSGYELKMAIDSSVGNFWSESFGQIYPELRRLEALGLVTPEAELGSNPKSKRRYAITDAGREELRHWLDQPPKIRPPRNELLLKLFFARQGNAALTRDHIAETREHYAKAVRTLRHSEDAMRERFKAHPDLPYWIMTIRHGILQYEAIVTWCDETIEQLKTLSPLARKNVGDEQ
jgi:PadR family transcriptional regulator AphA